ncbi:MAG: hypothetical protein ACRDVM_00595, partial [Acidimicrobiia bacterium]
VFVDKIEAQVQENVLGYWTNRGTASVNNTNQDLSSVTDYYECNGHGTDSWRLRAKGYDSSGLTKQRHGSAKTHTC